MEKAERILRTLLNAVDFGALAEEEPPKKSRFPCKRCGGEGWIFEKRDGVTVASLCPDCKAARENARMLAESGVSLADYERFTFANFRESTPMAATMKKAARDYLEAGGGSGIGFFGPSGIGKTHISIAILRETKKPYKYWKYRQEIQKLKNVMYKNGEEYERLMNRARNADCLYIDDLFQGAVDGGKLEKQDAQIMFDILDSRNMNRRRTLISSNCLLGEINAMNDAIASRIYALIRPYAVEIKRAENVRYGA